MIRLISFFLLFCFSLQVAAQDDESSKKLCNEALSKKALG
jgi:hypothetical protein